MHIPEDTRTLAALAETLELLHLLPLLLEEHRADGDVSVGQRVQPEEWPVLQGRSRPL